MQRYILGLLFLVVTGCQNLSGEEKTSKHRPYLFVFFAQQGDLHYAADDASEIYLTLRKVSRIATRLQPKPDLSLDVLPLEQFLQKWRDGQILVSNQSGIMFVFNHQADAIHTYLQHPRYDAVADTLTFEVTQVDANQVLNADKVTDITVYVDAMVAF